MQVQGGTGGTGGTGAPGYSGGFGGYGGYGVYITSDNFQFTNNAPVYGGTGGNGGAAGAGGTPGFGNVGGTGIQVGSFAGDNLIVNTSIIQGGTGGRWAPGGEGINGGWGNSLTIQNSGVISGGMGGQDGGPGGWGIVGSNLNIITSGSIAGGLSSDGSQQADAILFSGGTNSLTLLSGYSISGAVSGAGNDTLILGGAQNATFDLGSLSNYTGFSTFNKTGSSLWILTGTGAFLDGASGAVNVQAGTLELNGNLTAASITVNTPAANSASILRGSGTANVSGGVEVQSGGTLFPGSTGEHSGGQLTINGPLTFDSGATFQATGFVSATGVYSTDNILLNGNLYATPQGSSQVVLNGVYLPGKQYDLITLGAGNTINGALAANADFTATDTLMTVVSAKIQYQNDPIVFITPQSNFASLAKTKNQSATATAIDTAGNLGAYGPSGAIFLGRLIMDNTNTTAPAAYTALSGEGLTGVQQTALNAANQFANMVMGQATFWSEDRRNFGLKDTGYGGYKDGGYDPRARFWAAAFGGHADLSGQPSSPGSASLSSNAAGAAGGFDYQVTPSFLFGFAGGYSSSTFSVADRATSGAVDGAHGGVYGVARSGGLYVAGAADYAHYNDTTTRTIAYNLNTGGAFNEFAKGSFGGDEWLGRMEAGYKIQARLNVTPFAGFQLATLSNSAFSETSSLAGGGAGVAGLHVNALTLNSEQSFVGIQIDGTSALGNGWMLTSFARAAWDHEFNPTRSQTAFLLSLPASSFRVDGASAAQDAAKVDAGFKLDFGSNWDAFASFDGEFSERGNSYGGTGGVKIRF